MNQFMNPTMNPYMVNQPNPYAQKNNGINWVQGIEGAKAYQLPPSSNAILLDSENDGKFYIKISDNVGMCSLRTFRYREVTTPTNNTSDVDLSEYVKKSELQALIQSIKKEDIVDEQTVPATVRTIN